MMTLKKKLKTICLERLNDKIDALQGIIEDMSLDAQNDAKSSAGDKHETSLSMMHLEQENLSKKILENIAMRDIVAKIDEEKESSVVEFGSFVQINSVYLFFSAALPKINVDGKSILAVSMDAPIAKELLGRKLHDRFTFNNCEFTVHELE
ncbi:hypothetical protein HX017_12570 [Myroides marinus]|nr:hypothetical protein [Myroides marinus]MDM1351971.1 hypothetical protein [Myroides marinus]MDM1355498.1 hypothetical protein [Myroides marinus]MDM1359201.1 hypothetical protein [Myroides marinus]MDM1362387.1 hypothetical protein [Myroides marinus]